VIAMNDRSLMRVAIAALVMSVSGCVVKSSFRPPIVIAGVKTPGASTSEPPSDDGERSPPMSDDEREAQAPEVPDPDPPAYRDGEGVVHGPGGPIAEEPGDCGPARNHCLRGNAWFTGSEISSDDGRIHHLMLPVFIFEGHWYSWKGKHADNGTVKRTRPATLDTLKIGHDVYVFVPRGDGKVPASPKAALTARQWDAVAPYTIDAKAGTFFADGQTYSIAAARVPFDARATP
jgi:hypothetical protein